MTRSALWIMADQLRRDYLSCYGHKTLHTPNIDRLAAKGVRFNRTYVQPPFCGPSRVFSYTGRYCRSHGAMWNGFLLRVGEPTLGDHQHELGVHPPIVGKTHMVADTKRMDCQGIDQGSEIEVRISECGIDPYKRDDGMHPYKPYDPVPRYSEYLREQGINSTHPWEEYANSADGDGGDRLSGWLLKFSNLPADIPEELSETPYMTMRAMELMEETEDPQLSHVCFIKPHWTYIVPAPCHEMYGPDDIQHPFRSEAEKDTDHPVFGTYIQSRICHSFSRDMIRKQVVPAYVGLIKYTDDQMARLLDWMKEKGLAENTMVMISSNHGDYLGDHWMGEKDLIHDQSVRVQLIVYEPRSETDATRAPVRDELVEGIDLAPTFLRFFGGEDKLHILEGRALDPLLHHSGQPETWRKYAISAYDYSTRDAKVILDQPQEDNRLWMITDERWKIYCAEGLRPMLLDLESDPQELDDPGASNLPDHVDVRPAGKGAIPLGPGPGSITRASRQAPRRTGTWKNREPPGLLIGFRDEQEFEYEFGKLFAERP